MVCLFRMMIVCLFLAASACSSLSKEGVKRAQAERACINQCQTKLTFCKQHCEDGCAQCEKEARDVMIKRYKRYVYNQSVQGKRLALQLQSFRDPLKCRKTSCDCLADYRVCVSTCKGNIRKYLQVTPFCC